MVGKNHQFKITGLSGWNGFMIDDREFFKVDHERSRDHPLH